jgi:hypothetical protein
MLKNLLKLYCIWTWDTLWCFFVLWFFFSFFFPFGETMTELLLRHHLQEAKGPTPKLLRLKLYCIWTLRFFIFSILYCLSNACSAYCWLVHYLSLFIYLFVCFVFFYTFVYSFFPFSLTSLLSISSHLSKLNITIVITTR